MLTDIYSECPIIENSKFLLRFVSKEDWEDLLNVYSDVQSHPLFNSDNCNGDKFHYMTKDEMVKAIDFWIYSFNYRWFVRWSIMDKTTSKVIGTVEAFRRKATDSFNDCCLVRIDLRHDYEKYSVIKSILDLMINPLYEWFQCDRLLTKGFEQSIERTQALLNSGFCITDSPVIGNYESYYHYWIRKK